MAVFNYLYDVIVEEQPEVVTLDDSDVVSTIGPAIKRKMKHINHCEALFTRTSQLKKKLYKELDHEFAKPTSRSALPRQRGHKASRDWSRLRTY